MKVVVTCGYNSSKHTIALLYLMQQKEIQVDKCIIVTAFSLKRARAYYRQLDKKEFFKKFRDRILSPYIKQTPSEEVVQINKLADELGIRITKVSDFCRKHNIAYKIVSDLNAPETLEFIGDPHLGIYSGGGILRKKFLEKFSIGVLNCHGAKLPEIRGYNTAEWSILMDVPLMNTIHFMVRALDMGPIINCVPHDYSSCINVDQLRGLAIRYTVYDLLNAVELIQEGTYSKVSQKRMEGKQYFAMHRILKNYVNKKLLEKHG